jgi:hypothetical protein
VPNKANSAQAAGRASALWKQTYGELYMQETSAKQSQFAHRRYRAKARKGARAAGRTELYKQSQFAPGGLEEPLGQGRKCHRGRAGMCKTKKQSQFLPRADTMVLEYATVCRPHPACIHLRGVHNRSCDPRGSDAVAQSRGEGILPLRVAGILPAIRRRPRTEGPLRVRLDTKEQGRDALATRPRNDGHAPICGLPLAAGCGFGYKNGVFRRFDGPDDGRSLRMT